MESKDIFKLALNLESPWYIKDVTMKRTDKTKSGSIDIYLDFARGSKFKDSHGVDCPVHDTISKTWQHLNFFEHTCYIHARVPRIKTSEGKVEQVQVSWSRPGSGFTLLFEGLAMLYVECEMPFKNAAKVLKIYDTRLSRIFNYWVKRAISNDIQKDVVNIGIDETSTKKGHNYVSTVVDMESKRVIFVTQGKDQSVVEKAANHLENKGCPVSNIKHISIDMSPAFIHGATKYFPKSKITFDKFHIVKLLNEAIDGVRKMMRKGNDEIKGSKYLFLKNKADLSNKELEHIEYLLSTYDNLAEAYKLKEMFQDFWELTNSQQAEEYLAFWCDLAIDSNLTPFIKFTNTLKSHWSGIVNYFKSKLTNGILEGINSKIQLAKRRARGFRNNDNFINMIYFIAGKLKYDYPLYLA